ncbi:MAG: bifunctional (p)ppGpp synthetase/guanosine-3',5'-bis(diphosphate) 3'-pyrophosphohydrolase [Oscillospiraceae bacterium]|nr:bifunctional (p)ppGpp synthetase/guanosine-3',5'-bis(diphosphate) 3'-pyrophosphohydrolase [Oscillospiraceae bacterium]
MNVSYESLLNKLNQSGKTFNIEKIYEAFMVADQAHGDQKRVSGEPYIIHPLNVAMILVDLGMDTDTVVAALLHDVVEDTEIPLHDIEKKFGKDVALLVDGVTKLGRIPFSSREQQQAENVRKMLLAMAQDVRVIIIKLADRLHNMRTISVMPDHKRRDKSLETMEVYAPLAHRLGIRAVKEELEDLSLSYLDPIGYQEIEEQLATRKEDRQLFLERIKARLYDRLSNEHENMMIEGRVKSIYGIYRKVYMQGRAFESIYDVYAVRIIVDSVFECYNILGIIHDVFRPIPNRFKDYISTPKPNMYQSLHTTVIDTEGIPFEVQIRTWDMHYTAEYGVAAHWKYKVGISGKDSLEDRLAWVRQLLESQKESDDVEDIVKSIKTDIAPEEVFVFTPKGDVISLPTGSTVIDFAYAIHTAVGNRMTGAKIDGRIVSLDSKVKTGNIVDIITTGQNNGPSRDWLNIVRTSEARNKIRSWFKKERREENIAEGKAIIEREFKRNLIHFDDKQREEYLSETARRMHYNSPDDFYAALGYGGLSVERIMPRIKEDYIKNYKTPDTDKVEKVITKRKIKASSGVIVEGLDSCLVKFAHCCNPLPGDEIVGFVTRGFGVSIHKKDCTNVCGVRGNCTEPERWVKAEWAEKVKEAFDSTLDIYCVDRSGLLADLSVMLSNLHVPIHALNSRVLKDQHATIQVTVSITGLEQLNQIINSVKKIPGVVDVERTTR